ncbi:low-affinity potassium transport protein [Pelomyxa schiedti]|nr:low-affinity potassium transport protein [Pelomyxa schiedti]
MMAFYTSPLALIITGLFQLLGQTWLPVLLRLIVVGIYQLKKKFNQDYGTLYYIKHNSRSVTTVIFPKNENRNLLFILLAATGIEWSFLMGLNWNIVGIGCNWFQKVTMTLFQAICSRTTGFNVFDMNLLQPGMLVLTAIMLYMSTYPMTIVMRSTSTTPSFMQTPGGSDSRALYHTKKQMISDILWVVLPFFVICTIEGNKITSDPNFTHFKVLFEVISGYANVGLSLGYPNKPFSFSGTWHTSSKLILTVCMLFGHHRGFPDHIDQAIRPMFNLVNREVSVKEREAPAPHVREDHVSSRHTTFDGTIRRSSRDEEARASRDDDEEKGDAAPPPAQIKPPQMCTNTIPNAPSPPFSENSSQYLGSSQEQLGSPAPIPSPSL